MSIAPVVREFVPLQGPHWGVRTAYSIETLHAQMRREGSVARNALAQLAPRDQFRLVPYPRKDETDKRIGDGRVCVVTHRREVPAEYEPYLAGAIPKGMDGPFLATVFQNLLQEIAPGSETDVQYVAATGGGTQFNELWLNPESRAMGILPKLCMIWDDRGLLYCSLGDSEAIKERQRNLILHFKTTMQEALLLLPDSPLGLSQFH